ncbi:MAG: hypothetical protein Q8Q42_00415 [Nanoarchaeota archaeon]|nr:hypothetical protein [Nanoarchaeota archaeon]
MSNEVTTKIGTYFPSDAGKVDVVYSQKAGRSPSRDQKVNPKWGIDRRANDMPPYLVLIKDRKGSSGVVFGSEEPINPEHLTELSTLITESIRPLERRPTFSEIARILEKNLEGNWNYKPVKTELTSIE